MGSSISPPIMTGATYHQTGIFRLLMVAEKEKIRVPRRIVSEDMAEEINRSITELRPGMIVTVVYYNEQEQEYLQLTGTVAKLYKYERILQIVKTKIKYNDIYEIIK